MPLTLLIAKAALPRPLYFMLSHPLMRINAQDT